MVEKKPNPQNIPIQTEVGRRLRDAFVELHEPMQVDYSELELRILAAILKEPK